MASSSCPFKSRDKDMEQPYYCPEKSLSSEELIDMESEYNAHNYHPLPVVFEKAEGVVVWDPEGRKYFDFLSAYSAVNQGHCHPKLVQALTEQAKKCTLSSRAFYNSVLPRFAKFVTEFFGFEMVLPMNSGAEAVETALKVCRKWGYDKKGIPENEAIILSAKDCFHGRTLGVISMSSDPDCKANFGPFLPGMVSIEYNSTDALKEAIKKYGKRICGFLVEPIQGEAGVVVPDDGYLKKCSEICKENGILLMADEIQTGIARTGKLICCDWDGMKPDILILGKALSGGMLPVSCVLSSKEILLCIKPGQHGSTFGGNPLAAAVSIAALQIVREEKLAERALEMGEKFRKAIREMNCPAVKVVRGRGLLNAIVIDQTNFSVTAWQICLLLKERGLLAKPTHENIIRLAPPLVITAQQMDECLQIIKGVLTDIYKMSKEELPQEYVPKKH